MRDISARKRFIESEFAPEDTSVIWLKLANDHENINNMKIEDMLQFVNGKWSSILNSGGGSSDIPNPFCDIDSSSKILITRATVQNIDGDYTLLAGLDTNASFSDNHIINGKPNIGALLKALYPYSMANKIGVFGYVYKDDKFTPIRYFSATTYISEAPWSEGEECILVAATLVSDTKSYNVLYSMDWPEEFDDLKLTWDDLN